MNPGGVLLVLGGIWVITQLLFGGLLDRLGLA